MRDNLTLFGDITLTSLTPQETEFNILQYPIPKEYAVNLAEAYQKQLMLVRLAPIQTKPVAQTSRPSSSSIPLKSAQPSTTSMVIGHAINCGWIVYNATDIGSAATSLAINYAEPALRNYVPYVGGYLATGCHYTVQGFALYADPLRFAANKVMQKVAAKGLEKLGVQDEAVQAAVMITVSSGVNAGLDTNYAKTKIATGKEYVSTKAQVVADQVKVHAPRVAEVATQCSNKFKTLSKAYEDMQKSDPQSAPTDVTQKSTLQKICYAIPKKMQIRLAYLYEMEQKYYVFNQEAAIGPFTQGLLVGAGTAAAEEVYKSFPIFKRGVEGYLHDAIQAVRTRVITSNVKPLAVIEAPMESRFKYGTLFAPSTAECELLVRELPPAIEPTHIGKQL